MKKKYLEYLMTFLDIYTCDFNDSLISSLIYSYENNLIDDGLYMKAKRRIYIKCGVEIKNYIKWKRLYFIKNLNK